MPFGDVIKNNHTSIVVDFQYQKPKVGLRGFIFQNWFDVPYNTYQQQMEHIDARFRLSLLI
jgi:hypothetical protein